MGRHRIPPRIDGRDAWSARTGYIHQSDQSARLERDRSDLRFHFGVRAYYVAITLAATAISLGWIDLNSLAGTPDASGPASDATAPRASSNPLHGVEAAVEQPSRAE